MTSVSALARQTKNKSFSTGRAPSLPGKQRVTRTRVRKTQHDRRAYAVRFGFGKFSRRVMNVHMGEGDLSYRLIRVARSISEKKLAQQVFSGFARDNH